LVALLGFFSTPLLLSLSPPTIAKLAGRGSSSQFTSSGPQRA